VRIRHHRMKNTLAPPKYESLLYHRMVGIGIQSAGITQGSCRKFGMMGRLPSVNAVRAAFPNDDHLAAELFGYGPDIGFVSDQCAILIRATRDVGSGL